MGKKCENARTPKYVVASEKRRSIDKGYYESCYKWNSDIHVRREHINLNNLEKQKQRPQRKLIKRRVFEIVGYFFCILGIICAWGAVDTLVDLISEKQVYVSLLCYSITLLIGFLFLSFYIYVFDRNYKPHESI